MNIIQAKNQLKEIETLADITWHEHYINIISKEQIDYMLKNFQSEAAVLSQTEDGYKYFLFEDNGKNIGYMSYKINENSMFLSKIYILSEYRGKGSARAAIEFLKEICVAQKCNKIWLTVNQNNKNSIKAYEKMGFVKDRIQVADIGNGFFMEDFIMELKI